MKKSTCLHAAAKSALILGGLLGGSALVNHIIFKRANKKQKAKMKESYYEWHHGNIHYITAGSGRPLLLIHGMTPGSGLHEWKKNITVLSRHYKVYALDLLGFGYSDKPGISYSSYLYVTLINNFIQDVIGEKVLVAASDVSAAYTVMAHAFRPELYRKMLFISPSFGPAPAKGKQNLIGRLMEWPVVGTTLYNAMTSKLYTRWLLKKYCLNTTENFGALINQYHHAAHFGGATAKYPFAAFLSGFLSVPVEDKLAQLDMPVHVVCGGNSANSYPSLDLTVMEGCKLWPHIENHKAFYKICRRFFK